MGKLDLLPVLGKGFPKIFPIFFALLLLLKAFNVYEKALRCIGVLEGHKQSAGYQEALAEGKKIVFRERMLLNKSHDTNN